MNNLKEYNKSGGFFFKKGRSVKWQGDKFHYPPLKELHIIQVGAAESPTNCG